MDSGNDAASLGIYSGCGKDVLDIVTDVLARRRYQRNCTVLREEDLRRDQEENIVFTSTYLSLPREVACILLRHYSWNVRKAREEWLADKERVRKTIGWPEKPVQFSRVKEVMCGICFNNYPPSGTNSTACGHPFCATCWKAYISRSINKGSECLNMRCPESSCDAAVGQDMINILASVEDKDKYYHYFLKSYVEDTVKRKWCPAPGCDYAIEYIPGNGSYDVTCCCSFTFCWNCTEEAHRPVDCETVAKWVLKNSVESKNMNCILATSKPCPKCKKPVEKNQSCMHMTCTPCNFEFCWLCLGAWSDHSKWNSGKYECNLYEAAKEEGTNADAEMAKNSLKRYTHYYERWAANHSLREKAIADLRQMQTVHLEKLSRLQCYPESRLKFITEALQQIVECRRVLKWTYAYGYYQPKQELAKKQLFEYLQGEAEAGLEVFHQCVEKELQAYLNAEGPSKDFNDYRTKLVNLTSVTQNYFGNLVRALEECLSEVDFHLLVARCKIGAVE